jgi:hypothetical protein
MMSWAPEQLARLREIGWSLWDPIGLEDFRDDCEDEYDDYLLEAFARLQRGAEVEDVARYLMEVEATHMGLGPRASALARATTTTEALALCARERLA